MKAGPAKLIRTNGTVEAVKPKRGTAFTLKELQTLVGGYIEVLYPPSRTGAVLVVNEEGRLRGLPPNKVASAVYGGGFIVGDALLCHTSQIR